MSVDAKTLVARLSGVENERRHRFIALAVDHTFEQPLRTFVHFEDIADVITDALTETNAAQLIQDEMQPLRERLNQHFRETQETPADLVPKDTPDALIRIISKAERPKAEWAKGAVDTAPLRNLISPIVQDVLLRFTKNLPIPGLGGEPAPQAEEKSSRSSGLLGSALRKSAGSIAGMGKAALGNISGELEKRVQTITRDFANQAMTEVRGAIGERLRSPEGQKVIRDIRASIVERFLSTPVITLLEDGDRAPIEELIGLLPAIVEHNRLRPELRAFIESEVQYLLNTHGDSSIGDLLDRYQLREALRERIITRIDAPVASFIESKGFEAWLDELLKG